MKSNIQKKAKEILRIISNDRLRTNLLKEAEQKTLAYLVQHIPSRITSDMLTFLGFLGSLTVFISFILATYIHNYYLLLGILGFTLNWFGDSLDGRIAFYRKKPRKWYGFSLDITTDWAGIILVGWGYLIYSEGIWEMVGYGFVVMYAWAIITTLMKYKITGQYTIDSGSFGPTEVRIIISVILITEVIIKNSIHYFAAVVFLILFIVNIFNTLNLLRSADDKDISDEEMKLRKQE